MDPKLLCYIKRKESDQTELSNIELPTNSSSKDHHVSSLATINLGYIHDFDGTDTKGTQPNGIDKKKKDELPEVGDYDTSCGVWGLRPNWLQRFGRIGVFVGIYSITGLLTSTLIVYVNSQISMLEKQFGFSSKESGFIMACNDIGFLCTAVFVGHLANKVHIPKGLFVSTILFGICGVFCSLPFFIQDKSVFDLDKGLKHNTTDSTLSRSSKSMRAQLCLHRNTSVFVDISDCDADNGKLTSADLEQLSIKKIAFALIAIGMMLQGVGKSARYPFVTLYIDDVVEKRKTAFYMGIIKGTAIFGPAVAYALGGLFSKIYVTLEDVDISPRDPRWIGAWWLGFVIFGGISIITSFPILCFPYRLKTKELRATAKRTVEEEKPLLKKILCELKYFFQSIFRVVSNPVFTLSNLGTCIHILGIAGAMSFMSKYIEIQFSIPLWQANIIQAVSTIGAVSLGAFLGGVATRKINMTPPTTLGIMVSFYVINLLFHITGFFLGCDQPPLYGNNLISTGSDLYQTTSNNSSLPCICDDQKYYPICGNDDRSYFSPCHAGCPVQNKAVFQNCTAIPDGHATGGLCLQHCHSLWPWAILNFVGALIAALKIMPKFILTIRSVEERDRSMAAAFASFSSSAIGWMLGPIIFGALIDESCVLWKYICHERQSCYLYDITHFRNVIYGVGTATRGFSTIVHFVAYLLVRKKSDWTEISDRNTALNKSEKPPLK